MPRDENKHINRDQQSLFAVTASDGITGGGTIRLICSACEPQIVILQVDDLLDDPLTLRQITDAAHNHLRERGW